ncbi:BgTH12-05663 [Blumeria graminis f. sp. triticale]|uniref:BgTH12-05663 n=1 Tax=Blumeria graminis f. sp. triticale TaxID=1689686 RepID=A0A9W4D396_BLUGR|nr:BgTH12-05663 [Blumeria graminis f. sp. triticale]
MDIIAAYSMPQQEEYEDEEAAEPPAAFNQALNGLKHLLSLKEHELDANSMELTTLVRMGRSLQQQAELRRRQGILDSLFK